MTPERITKLDLDARRYDSEANPNTEDGRRLIGCASDLQECLHEIARLQELDRVLSLAREACLGIRLFTWLTLNDETRGAFEALARQIQHIDGTPE